MGCTGEERAENVITKKSKVGEVRFSGREDGGECDERINHPPVVGDKLRNSCFVRCVQRVVALDETVTSMGGKIRRAHSLASNPVLFWKIELMLALRA